MSSKIQSVHARQIIDCKCRPMVEVDVITEDGSIGTGCAPTGSSVGMYESYVLRDNDPKEYHGLSVHKAVDNVNQTIAPALVGMDVHDLAAIDHKMIDLDGTKDKHHLGGKRNLLGIYCSRPCSSRAQPYASLQISGSKRH